MSSTNGSVGRSSRATQPPEGGDAQDPRDSTLQQIEDLLECPVCQHLMAPPIHQCINGHALCSGCYAEISNCPVCRVELIRCAPIRALVLEKLIDIHKIKYPCMHDVRGCSVELSWGQEKREHEAQCEYRLVACPCKTHGIPKFSTCHAALRLSEVYDHFIKEHRAATYHHAGDILRLTTMFGRDSDRLVWTPHLLGQHLMVFLQTIGGHLYAYIRHIRGSLVKYRLRLSGNGSDVSFTGFSNPIDMEAWKELQLRNSALFVHRAMLESIGTVNGDNSISFNIHVDVLS